MAKTKLERLQAKARRLRKENPKLSWPKALKLAASGTKNKGKKQTGTSNYMKDIQRSAKAPGKRKSSSGRTYYETRRNRSDVPGTLSGITETNLKHELLRRLKESLGKKSVELFQASGKREKDRIRKEISKIKSEIKKMA